MNKTWNEFFESYPYKIFRGICYGSLSYIYMIWLNGSNIFNIKLWTFYCKEVFIRSAIAVIVTQGLEFLAK